MISSSVRTMITFMTPFLMGATDHDFFRPEVGLSSGNFLCAFGPEAHHISRDTLPIPRRADYGSARLDSQ